MPKLEDKRATAKAAQVPGLAPGVSAGPMIPLSAKLAPGKVDQIGRKFLSKAQSLLQTLSTEVKVMV